MKRDWKLIREILESIEENKVKIYWETLNQEQQQEIPFMYKSMF